MQTTTLAALAQQNWLDEEHLQRSVEGGVEWHPLRPFLPENARVLFLGSFPPPRRRWCVDFFYPNYINDHWRIEGLVFFGDKNYFVDPERRCFRLDRIIPFCVERGLAFYDTATAVRRLAGNASDKFLEVVQPTDIQQLAARLPRLQAMAVTGEKAFQTLSAVMPGWDGRIFRLPSSSRAYPLPLEKKADAYRQFFRHLGLI